MGESRWIVLIDKTPRGPLTESEVRTLIEQKVIRVNDLASRIATQPDGKKAEWKFLWQYPEFDRRRETDNETPSEPQSQERRDKKTLEKIEEQKKTLLPEDLENIHPEDLAYHSTAQPMMEKPNFENQVYETNESPNFSQPKQFNWQAFAIIPVMAVAGVIAFKFTNRTPEASFNSAPSRARPESEVPAAYQMQGDYENQREPSSSGDSSPLSRAQPKSNRPSPPSGRREDRREAPEPLVPRPGDDAGELSYEEYKRRQDEQIENDKMDEDDRQRAEEVEEEEKTPAKKKPEVKKRKAASTEEDEEEQTDPLEETMDEEHRSE